jgi:hypothetical protein
MCRLVATSSRRAEAPDSAPFAGHLRHPRLDRRGYGGQLNRVRVALLLYRGCLGLHGRHRQPWARARRGLRSRGLHFRNRRLTGQLCRCRGLRAHRRHFNRTRRHGARRQEAERVDVALLVARDTDSEVDVRLGQVERAGRPNRPHDGALLDRPATGNPDRAQVQQCRRVAEGRLDGHRLAAGRHGACE